MVGEIRGEGSCFIVIRLGCGQRGVAAEFVELKHPKKGMSGKKMATLNGSEAVMPAANEGEQTIVRQASMESGDVSMVGERCPKTMEYTQSGFCIAQKLLVAVDTRVEEWVVDVQDRKVVLNEGVAHEGIFVAVFGATLIKMYLLNHLAREEDIEC